MRVDELWMVPVGNRARGFCPQHFLILCRGYLSSFVRVEVRVLCAGLTCKLAAQDLHQ